METISVHVRVRPLNRQERNEVFSWRIDGNSISQAYADSRDISTAVYTLDNVFDQAVTTSQIYAQTAQPLLSHVLDGINGTILAYGQTSSGKTFTMHGTDSNPGIIPLAMEEIFEMMSMRDDRMFFVYVSYMELYNEEVNDLLNPQGGKLEIKEHRENGVYVSGLAVIPVTSAGEVLQLLRQGETNRHTAATRMNERSSRSHTVFRMDIESRKVHLGEEEDAMIDQREILSTLTLVDLAGSERVAKTGAEGVRMKEGTAINKSLLTLGNVINKLSESHTAGGHVPYRDSKLTRILQPSLGGNAKTAIICAMTPATCHIEESHQTLRFATRAKRVVNHAKVNEVIPTEVMLKMQEKTIQDLQSQLQELKAQKDAGFATDIEEQIKQLQKRLQVSEKDKIDIMQTLEQEKIEREKAQMQAEMAKKLLEIQPDDAQRSRLQAYRRGSWCPGDQPRPNLISSREVADQLLLTRRNTDVDIPTSSLGRKRHMEVNVDQYPAGDVMMRASQRARSMSEGPDSPTASQEVDDEISSRLPRKILEAQLKETREELHTLKRAYDSSNKDHTDKEFAVEQLAVLKEEIAKCRLELEEERRARTQLQYENEMHQTSLQEMSTKAQPGQKVHKASDAKSEMDQDADLDSISMVAEPAGFNVRLQAALEQAAEAEQRAVAAETQCQLLKEVLAEAETNLHKLQEEKEEALEQAARSMEQLKAEHEATFQRLVTVQEAQEQQYKEVVETLSGKIAHLEEENTVLAQQLAQAPQSGAKDLDVDVEDMKMRLDQAKEREDRLRGEIEELEQKMQLSEGEIRMLVRGKAELESELRQMRKENDPYKSRFVDISTVAAAKEKEDSKDSRLKNRQEITTLKAEVQKLQTETKAFAKVKETLQKDLDTTRKKLLETDAKLKQANQERADAVQDKAVLERKLRTTGQKTPILGNSSPLDRKNGSMLQKMNNIKVQAEATEERLQTTLASLNKAQDDLKSKTNELSTAQLLITELKSELTIVTDDKDGLEGELARTKQQMMFMDEEHTKLQKQVAVTEARVSDLVAHCDVLEQELTKKTAQCLTLEDAQGDIHRQLAEKEAMVQALTQTKQELTAVIDDLKQQVKDTQLQMQEMEQQKQSTARALEQTSADLSSAVAGHANAQTPPAESAAMQKQLQETQEQLAALESTYQQLVHTAQQEKEDLETTIEELRAELQEVQASLAEQNEEVETLRRRCTSLSNTNKILSDQNAEQVKETDRLYAENDALKQKVKEATTRVSTPSKTLPRASISRSIAGPEPLTPDALQQQLAKQKELNAKLAEEKSAEVQSLQDELQHMHKSVSAAQSQVVALKAEVQQYKLLLSRTSGPDARMASPSASPEKATQDRSTNAGAEFDHIHLSEILIESVAQRSAVASPTTAHKMATAAADYASAVLRSDVLKEQLEDANQKNKELQQKVAELASSMQQLKALADVGANAPGLQQEVMQLKEELHKTATKKNNYERQLEVLQKEASSLADKASKEQAYYASEMMRVKAELDGVLAEKGEMEQEMQSLREELEQVAAKAREEADGYAAEIEALKGELAQEEEKAQALEKELIQEREKYNIQPDNVCANLEATVQQLLFAASPQSNQSLDMIRSMAMSDYLASVEVQSDQPRSARRSSAGSDGFRDGSTDAGSPLGIKLPAVPELPEFPAPGTDGPAQKKVGTLPTVPEVTETGNMVTPAPGARPAPITPGDLPAPDMCMSPGDINITPADARLLRTQLGAARTQVQQLAAALRAKVVENGELQQDLAQVKAELAERDTRSKSCLPHISAPVPKLSPRDRAKSPGDKSRSASPSRNAAGNTTPEPDQKRLVDLERKLQQQLDMLHGYANDKAVLQVENQQLSEQVVQLKDKLDAAAHKGGEIRSQAHDDAVAACEEAHALLEASQQKIAQLRQQLEQAEADKASMQAQLDEYQRELNGKLNSDEDAVDNNAVITAQEAMICNLRRQLTAVSSERDRLIQQYEPPKKSPRASPGSNFSSPRPMMISPVLKSRTGLSLAITPPSTEKFSKVPRFGSPLKRGSSRENSPAHVAGGKSPASPRVLKQLGATAMNFSPLTKNQVNIEAKDAKQVSALHAGETVLHAEVPAAQRMVAYMVNDPEPGIKTESLPSGAAQQVVSAEEVAHLKEEVDKLQKELQDKSDEVRKLQDDLLESTTAKDTMQMRLDSAQAECKRLQTVLEKERVNLEEQVTARIMEASEEQAKLTANATQREARLTELQKQNDELQASKETLTRKLQDLRSELNTMLQQSVAKCEVYQQQVEQLDGEKKRAIEEVKTVNMRNAELMRKLEAAEGHASTHINAVKAMETQHAVYTKQLADLERQVSEAKALASTQKDTIRLQQSDIKAYEREVKHLQDELEKKDKQLKDDIDAYEAEVQQLKEQLASKDAKLKHLQEDLEAIRLQQEKLETDAQTMQSRHFKETQRLQDQTETFKLEHASTKHQLEALKTKLEEVTTRLAAVTVEHDKVLAERRELQEQVSYAFKELAAVNEKAETCEKENDSVMKQMALVQQELSAAYKEQHMDKAARISLQQRVDELESKITSMTEEKYHLEVKVKEQARLKRFCIDSSPDPVTVQQELTAAKQEITKLEQRVRVFEAAEMKWTQDRMRLEREVKEAAETAKQQKQQDQWQPSLEEYERLEQEVSAANEDRLRLEDQINELLKDKEDLEVELDAARRRSHRGVPEQDEALAEQNRELQEELSSLRHAFHQARKLMEGGKNQLTELNQRLEESQEANKHLAEENMQLVQDSRQLQQEKMELVNQLERAKAEAADVVQRMRGESGLVDIDALADVQRREQELQKELKRHEERVRRLEEELKAGPPSPTPINDPRIRKMNRDELMSELKHQLHKLDVHAGLLTKLRKDVAEKGLDLEKYDDLYERREIQFDADRQYNRAKRFEYAYKETERRRGLLEGQVDELREKLRKSEHNVRKLQKALAARPETPSRSNVVWADDHAMHSTTGDRARYGERSKSRERERVASAERERARSRERERARSATRSPMYRR